MLRQPQLFAGDVNDITPEDEKIPFSVDFDTSTSEQDFNADLRTLTGESKLSTDYGEQAAVHMIGEEFDDLLDLLNEAPEAVGVAALRNIKQLALMYHNLTVITAEPTADELPEGEAADFQSEIEYSGY